MSELVKVCTQKRILGVTDKAVCADIGRTFDGRTIITWFPKSACQIRPTITGYELWAPQWMNQKRLCTIGKYEPSSVSGFTPASTFFDNRHF